MDPFDVRLEDDELLDEVELTANLIVAANQSEARMSVTEIDEILGVLPAPAQGRVTFPAAARPSVAQCHRGGVALLDRGVCLETAQVSRQCPPGLTCTAQAGPSMCSVLILLLRS